MKSKYSFIYIPLVAAALLLPGCADDIPQRPAPDGALHIRLDASIGQEFTTRVNDNGFAHGDVMGVYVVDYQGNLPGTLRTQGNRADNVRHTFDETSSRWISAYEIYWKDNHTLVDLYGYYPAASPESVEAYAFTVQADQSRPSADGVMGGYEASDFLWGKVAAVAPTVEAIPLSLSHRMACARVTLQEGSGFEAGQWDALSKQVLVANTVREATVDLSTGTVTPSGPVSRGSIIPFGDDGEWRAIVVPQSVPAGTSLFSITVDGVAYTFAREAGFSYESGRMSNFTIRVDRKSADGRYSLTLVAESVTPWENDLASHDATAREYAVVDCRPGELAQCVAEAGLTSATVRNLKLTGTMDVNDFMCIREDMTLLQALNLKDVRIQGGGWCYPQGTPYLDDQIPPYAFYSDMTGRGKESLVRLILPDNLRSIGMMAFHSCANLSGSLVIPEGVVDIQTGAFTGCVSLTGSLSLPSTLKYIGNYSTNSDGEVDLWTEAGADYGNGVFSGCRFSGELRLPDNLEFIRGYAFFQCGSLSGPLRLPHRLAYIGERAFYHCSSITGSLDLPQGIDAVLPETFSGCGFEGNLLLHDGLATIGEYAFADTQLKGELRLPKGLLTVGEGAFRGCGFSGELVLPAGLVSVGANVFENDSRLYGTLEIPEGCETLGRDAFAGCGGIERVVLPASLDRIGDRAFYGCFSIGSIVCRAVVPPTLDDAVFEGVAKNNFLLEVPESSVQLYATAPGWCDFKRVEAHHELYCRPATASALSSGHTQTVVLNAEGEWELESKPDWCEVTPASGSGKTELTLTVSPMSGGNQREGTLRFRLTEKGYTAALPVSQYPYEYAEDRFITLQRASVGKGIDIVLLGDGYDARAVSDGTYMEVMREAMEHFFAVEPYASYRNYFNVYTAVALSDESGVGTLNTIRFNRFGTTFTGETGLRADYDEILRYACGAPTVDTSNIDRTLVVLIPNTPDYGSCCRMFESGAAVAICPKNEQAYPRDFRGVIQHEAGGHGFGKLGDEAVIHNAFIDDCDCTCCPHVEEFLAGKKLGWYDNLELTGKIHEVGWSHLIFDPEYSATVDVFEGGFGHSRGVFRSEQASCMSSYIPYFNAISRESIVKRILDYSK